MTQQNEPMSKIGIKKSLQKEYQSNNHSRIVYMKDGTEFQIYLRNIYTYTIGVRVTINSQPSSSLIVLRPGEHVWLDRFIDNPKKLKFSTYEVADDEISEAAIKDNGNITLSFYKEKVRSINSTLTTTYSPVWEPLTTTPYKYTSTCSNDNSNATCACDCFYLNNVSTSNSLGGFSTTCCSTLDNTIETGRVEKGSQSNQRFNEVTNEFESFAFKSEYIKLLPESQRPITTKDLMRKYCTQCGRKLNPKYKFCPQCGTKVE